LASQGHRTHIGRKAVIAHASGTNFCASLGWAGCGEGPPIGGNGGPSTAKKRAGTRTTNGQSVLGQRRTDLRPANASAVPTRSTDAMTATMKPKKFSSKMFPVPNVSCYSTPQTDTSRTTRKLQTAVALDSWPRKSRNRFQTPDSSAEKYTLPRPQLWTILMGYPPLLPGSYPNGSQSQP
jgi:hypothetical protein